MKRIYIFALSMLALTSASVAQTYSDASWTDARGANSLPASQVIDRVAPDSPNDFILVEKFDASASIKSEATDHWATTRALKATTTADLAGEYVMTSTSCVGYGTTGNAVTILPVTGTDSVTIQGFWSSSMAIKAKVDLLTSTITIPSQYLYTHTSYGPMDLSAVTTNGIPMRNEPIIGKINADGTLSIDTWWCVAVNEGADKDEIVDANRNTLMERPNGTMTYTMNARTLTFGVVATQPTSNVLKVKNFANRGNTLEISLNGYRSGIIAQQTVYQTSAGTYVSIGQPQLNESGQLIGWSPAIPLDTAAAGVNRTISWKEWATYLPKKSYSGVINNGIVNTSFDIEYPQAPSTSLTGDGTEANPYKITSLSDIIYLSNLVNNDTDRSGSMPLGNQTINYARSLLGQYVELTADIDMSGYRFTPIGWDLIHQFAGTFDGKGHKITGLTVECSGMGGLFGAMDANGTVRNLTIDKASISSNSNYYVGTVCGISYGAIEGCTATSPVVEQNGQVAGGIVGLGTVINNCKVTDGRIYSRYGFAGGVAGQVNASIINSSASNTYVMASAAESADPRYNNGGCLGGIVGSLLSAIATDCYFTGVVDAYSMGVSLYAGGIAGINHLGYIDGCFSAAIVRGTGTGAVNGGVAGWVSGSVRNSYSAGLVDCMGSYYTGGITGRIVQQDANNIPEVVGCYTSAQLIAERSSYDPETEMRETIGRIWPGSNASIENVYFDNQITNFTSKKGGISNADLTSGNPITGFDATKWTFTKNAYPRLTTMAEYQSSMLSASAILMPSPGTTLINLNMDVELSPMGETSFWLLNNGEMSKAGHFCAIDGNTLKVNTNMEIGNDTLVAANGGTTLLYFLKIAPSFLEGEGTAEKPYLISSKADMIALANATTLKGLMFADTYFRLTNDIDMENDPSFIGISNTSTANKFAGTIDGAGYAIHNLKMNRLTWTTPPSEGKLGTYDSSTTKSDVALICRLGATGVIKNLTMAADCSFEGLGGISTFVADSWGTIENCRNFANVTAVSTTAGGIVASLQNGSVIRNCYNAGHIVSGYQAVGGIMGSGTGFTVTGCVNTGTIEAKPICTARDEKATVFKYVAGIGGNIGGTFTISDCADYGHSYAYISSVGSIAGRIYGTPTLTNNLALGTIECPDPVKIGMMAGELPNSYTAKNNHWDAQLLPWMAAVSKPIDGATGLPTATLTSGKDLDGFDSELWSFEAGKYPVIKAFAEEPAVKAALITYFNMPEDETVGNLKSEATLPGTDGLQWKLTDGSQFRIDSNKLIVPAAGKTLVTGQLTASINGVYSKTFNLSVLPNMPLDGEGTAQSPYLINNVGEWQALAEYITATENTFDGKSFRITADLDFTGLAIQPIANDGKTEFCGTLDGAEHSIKNFSISTATQYFGIIGILGSNGTVKNLTMQGTITSTASHTGGMIGRSYGTLDNCVSEVTINTTKANVGGFIGQGLGGKLINCTSRATINTTMANAGGLVAISTARMSYDNCGFEGVIKSKSTSTSALNYGGLVANSWPSEFNNCWNKGTITCTLANANGIAGLVGYVSGAAKSNPFVFTDCRNYSDLKAGSKVCGLVASATTTAGYAPMTFIRCVNSGNITTTSASAYAAGLVGQATAGTSFTDCFNTGDITSNGNTVGGLVGTTGGIFSNTTPLTFNKCYNTGKLTASSSTVGGIIAYGGNFTTIIDCHNTGDISGFMHLGGLVGNHAAVNMTIKNCWNSGNITGTGGRLGGLTGSIGGTAVSISNSFNTGNVITSCTTQGTSTAAAKPSGYAIGGLGGYSTAQYSDCYNMGTVKGVSRVGGLVGDPATNKKLSLMRCYNAGLVDAPADTCGAIIGVNTSNGNIWLNSMVKDCYYTAECSTSTLPVQGTVKTTAELCATDLGEVFTSAGANCLPVLKNLSTVDQALLYAGQPIFAEGDNASKITKNFSVGTPAGVTWTMTGAQAEIADGQVSFTAAYTGAAELTATLGSLQRVIPLNVMVETTSIDSITDGREVIAEEYYTTGGLRVAKPESADGQIYIVIISYSDGTKNTVKLLNR